MKTIDEVKIVGKSKNIVVAYCTFYYFQYSLLLMLELVLIFFTINT